MSPSSESAKTYEMSGDEIVGDGGNVTVYRRPDGSLYALDPKGAGIEWAAESPVFGRARFDSRPLATGRWDASRSAPAAGAAADPARGRRRGSRFRTA